MENNLEFYEALDVLKDDKLKKARAVVIKTVARELRKLDSMNPNQARKDSEELGMIFSNLKKLLPSTTMVALESKDFDEYKGKMRNSLYDLVENSKISDQAKDSFLNIILPAIFTVVDSYVNDEVMGAITEEIPGIMEGFLGISSDSKSYEEMGS